MRSLKSSGASVIRRMDERTEALCQGFSKHLARFESSSVFGGPSLYFHRKAVAIRAGHSAIESLLADDDFADALYATLTAWGMHRMGPGNTKLRDLDKVRSSAVALTDVLQRLSTLTVTSVEPDREQSVAEEVWDVLSRLQVSVAEARIVANSKFLHHVLPELVPPMDREYTFRFFYARNTLSIDERSAFLEMFVRLLRIGRRHRTTIEAVPRSGWNSSSAKIIDNAVVGFMFKKPRA